MNYSFQQHEARKYLRRNRSTSEEEIISVTNRNDLSVEKHMELFKKLDMIVSYLYSLFKWCFNNFA